MIWKSISTSLNPVKAFQKFYFGENENMKQRVSMRVASIEVD